MFCALHLVPTGMAPCSRPTSDLSGPPVDLFSLPTSFLATHLPICLPIHPSIHPPIYLFIQQVRGGDSFCIPDRCVPGEKDTGGS